jgi:hypothetical protein
VIWVLGVGLCVVLLVILVAAIWVGIAALGTPADRAAGCETLRHAAGLLGAQFRDRNEYPWYRRPAQYGAVEGEMADLSYMLSLMPWNAEDCGGRVMMHIRSRLGGVLPGGESELVIFIPERIWHWPDLADPATLAGYARQAIATVSAGGRPPDAS